MPNPSPTVRNVARQADDVLAVMHVPISILVMGIACVAIFTFLGYAPTLTSAGSLHGFEALAQPTLTFSFWALAAFGLTLIATYFVERHVIKRESFVYRLLIKQGSMRWNDVAKVDYSAAHKWFRVENSDGVVVQVSVGLSGIEDFARTVLEKVNMASITPGARHVLTDCAQGNIPSIWK